MNRGILIAIEGIDGAGKTTQVAFLASLLARIGEPVVTSKEPTDGPWGQKIRKSATNGRMSLEDELRAFIEDRKEHVREIVAPALADGKTVILDRYYYSTLAYQGSRGGDVKQIARAMRDIAPTPDAVIILDVPVMLGLDRVGKRDGKANYFEEVDNLRAVREAFLKIAATDNLTIIDGSGNEQIVRRAILHSLLEGVFYRRHCAKHWGCDDPFNCVYRKTETCRWAQMKKLVAQFGLADTN